MTYLTRVFANNWVTVRGNRLAVVKVFLVLVITIVIMAEVSPAIIKKTQDLLGKVVKKPPLTDKLLRKPPFRFLHDVVNAVG